MADEQNGDDQGKQPEPEKEPQGDRVVFTSEQQAVIDQLIGGARTKAREQAQTDFETARAEAKKKNDEETKTARLKEEKKFQELITQHEGKIADIEPALETAQSQLTAYIEMAENILVQRFETLGEAAKTATEALPGNPDILAKLNWLTANEDLFKTKEQVNSSQGTPPRTAMAKIEAMRGKVTKTEEVPPVPSRF